MDVRIRGIYATALSALLPRHGVGVVGASAVIAERLGLPTDGAADVQVRDRPDHQALWLEGTRAQCASLAHALVELLPDAIPRELRGPAAWEVELPGGSKRALDAARATVWPTLPGHHQLKIIARDAVDRAEAALAVGQGSAEALAAELWGRYVAAELRPGRPITVAHVKPSGREIKLPARVASLERGRLHLTRTFRPGGSYDSLNVPKLVGDYGEVEQLVGSWASIRRYLRANGSPIGELYNIQTPIELYPTGSRYLDLEVDVAAWPNGRVEIVDLPDLEEAVQAGQLTPALADRALAVAEGVRATLARGERVELSAWQWTTGR